MLTDKRFQTLTSLGLRSNLIYDQFFSQVTETADYIAIQTPERPNFFWGNYLILKQLPQETDLEQVEAWFSAEIGPKAEIGFAAITYSVDTLDEKVPEPFLAAGYTAECHKILSTQSLIAPQHLNPDLLIRAYNDSDWSHYPDVHFSPDWGYGSDQQQIVFLQEEAQAFRKMVAMGQAQRFGAFLKGQMVADLGAYWQDELARFHHVGTHRDFRRQGACTKLVYTVAQTLLQQSPIQTLVMEADADYHAAAIYESLGFVAKHYRLELEWKDSQRFS